MNNAQRITLLHQAYCNMQALGRDTETAQRIGGKLAICEAALLAMAQEFTGKPSTPLANVWRNEQPGSLFEVCEEGNSPHSLLPGGQHIEHPVTDTIEVRKVPGGHMASIKLPAPVSLSVARRAVQEVAKRGLSPVDADGRAARAAGMDCTHVRNTWEAKQAQVEAVREEAMATGEPVVVQVQRITTQQVEDSRQVVMSHAAAVCGAGVPLNSGRTHVVPRCEVAGDDAYESRQQMIREAK